MVQELSPIGLNSLGSNQDGYGGLSVSKELQEFGKRNSDLFDGPEIDSKRLKMLREETPPLGLSLRKTESFDNLVKATLSQKNGKVSIGWENHKNQEFEKNEKNERARSKKEGDKWKAGNWNAKLLRIGSWERRAARDLDLVAKCYYAKKKLVWEMLDDGLKSKIEIQWSDITAIRAAFPKDDNAVLEIELNSVPLFFRETNPQPRKHTLWQAAVDFTGGQAPRYRRHHLQFEEGTLKPHYEKLLECDRRLRMLSEQPFPLNRSPYFNLDMSGYQEYSIEFNRPQAVYAPMLRFSQYALQKPSYVPFHEAHVLQTVQNPTVPTYTDLHSPMSVMEFPPGEGRENYNIKFVQGNLIPPVEVHDENYNIEFAQGNLIRGGMVDEENLYAEEGDQGDHVQQQFQFSTPAQQVNPVLVQPLSVHYPPPSGNGITRVPSNDSLLNIANQLLQAPVAYADEQRLMAKVKSMYNLLELSQEAAPVNAINESEIDYCHSADNSPLPWTTGKSNGNCALMPGESFPWLSVIGSNENSLMHPHRIPSFSNLIFEQAYYEGHEEMG